jgi:hypothetical protein
MFKVTMGKGVYIQFANGYSISIQWGCSNYCENSSKFPPTGVDYQDHQKKVGKDGAAHAEIAIMDRNDNFCGQELGIINGDDVEGWCTPERVTEVMGMLAAIEVDEGGYVSDSPMFKSLSADEVVEYKQWARDNYVCNSDINEVWHPVIQEECRLMNEEE